MVKNGIIFAYLGEGEAPAFPDFDCFLAPGTHAFAFKGLIECNWLQALGRHRSSPRSYLHRFYEDEDTGAAYGKQSAPPPPIPDIPMTRLLREFPRPKLDVEATDYGLRLFALRKLDEKAHACAGDQPRLSLRLRDPDEFGVTITQWHVPVDDTSCYWYAIFTQLRKAVDHVAMRGATAEALPASRLPSFDRPPQRLRLQRHGTEEPDPSPAWASATSTCTTSGRSRARGASRTAPVSISARAQGDRRLPPHAAVGLGQVAMASGRSCGSTRSAPRRPCPVAIDGMGPTEAGNPTGMMSTCAAAAPRAGRPTLSRRGSREPMSLVETRGPLTEDRKAATREAERRMKAARCRSCGWPCADQHGVLRGKTPDGLGS